MTKKLIYNMFPSNYSSIAEMQKKIEEIKQMGFNTIWLNPIQKHGNSTVNAKTDLLRGVPIKQSNSIYSMASTEELNEGFTEHELKTFVQKAQDEGMNVMFDLV